MLTILTFADLLSLSPTALTDWKKALLLSLFNKSMRLLDREYEQPASRPLMKLVDKVIKGHESESLTCGVIQEHVGQLPEQYVNVNTPDRIRDHLRGISHLDHKGVWSSFRKWSDVTLLTVITRDYPKALSDICGTITASDINILGAWIFTRNDGIIIDMFLVVGPEGVPVIDADIQKSFKHNLDKVFTGHVPVTKLITSHADRWKRKRKRIIYRPPQVRIHNDVSTRYTVIDVFAMDYTGLLYDISSVLASFKVDIHTAKIGTDEDRVADAFYVRKSGGGKIEDPELLKEIVAAILETLNRAYPETVTG
jgi:[protein-PII] uridylyltransferase